MTETPRSSIPATNTADTNASAPTVNPNDELTPEELEQKNKVGYSLDEEERPERVDEAQVEEEAEKGHS